MKEEDIRKKYQRDGTDKTDLRGSNVKAMDRFIEMLNLHEKSTDFRVKNIAENFDRIDHMAPNFVIFQGAKKDSCMFMQTFKAYQISENTDMFVASHEFGHAVLSIMNNNEVPQNYGDIILRAKQHALAPENREFFKEYIQYLCGKTDKADERTVAEKGPVSDIISSIFQQQGLRIGSHDNECYFPASHERTYYYDEEKNEPKVDKILDEDFANFYALKATNSLKEIETIRKLFGNEFIEALEFQLDKANQKLEMVKTDKIEEKTLNIMEQVKSVVVSARKGEVENIITPEKNNERIIEGEEK